MLVPDVIYVCDCCVYESEGGREREREREKEREREAPSPVHGTGAQPGDLHQIETTSH